jgi:hypothetical protein
MRPPPDSHYDRVKPLAADLDKHISAQMHCFMAWPPL